MQLDDELCYCFHVTRRKLVNFARRERLRVVSQMSECGGAGTGCGWCIPFLRKIFDEAVRGTASDLDQVSSTEYAQNRAAHLKAGHGKPPIG